MKKSVYRNIFGGLLVAIAFNVYAGSGTIKLKGKNGFESVSYDRILFGNLKLNPPVFDSKKPTKEILLEGQRLRDFLGQISFDAPEEPGFPAAMITGTLRLSLKSDQIRAVTEREFVIYNDELLNDSEAKTVFYRTKKPISYSNFK